MDGVCVFVLETDDKGRRREIFWDCRGGVDRLTCREGLVE